MQKKSPINSASVSARALVVLVVCAATSLIVTRTLPAFLRSESPAKLSQRTLTFSERVAYQRAIEDVYWRHRIWPKERSDPKPSLEAVMSQAQLEKKVTDYLRKSQTLEDYWQRPITAEQLQAEMDRMAKHTKQPEVLHELFEALGNDPFVIAECLARPALAERLLTSWYSYDHRIHDELKQRAEAELSAHPTIGQMKQLSGKYSEVEVVKTNPSDDQNTLRPREAIKLNSRQWDETVQSLAATIRAPFRKRGLASLESADISAHFKNAAAERQDGIPTGVVSSLREDETRYYSTALIDKSDDHLKLAIVSWPKQPVKSWLAKTQNRVPSEISAPNVSYILPTIVEGACVDNTWTVTAAPPDARDWHTGAWTGSEMIIWGGETRNFVPLGTGARYNPATDSWTPTNSTNAPTARVYHAAVWSGSEMIVWGGYSPDAGGDINTGARYDPGSDTWTAMSTMNAPDGRQSHSAVWTGSQMIVWGGYDTSGFVANTGGRYDAGTDSWTATTTNNAPTPRSGHTAVWSGSEMIVWGGYDGTLGVNTGARYNPNTDSWTATSTSNVPGGRYDHTAVWTDSTMIVWAGIDDSFNDTNTGGKYNPATNSWATTSIINAPDGRHFHTAVWTGSQMIVWGGYSSFQDVNTGGRYNPNADSWTETTSTNAPEARDLHTAVWTGSEMIVWGGSGTFNDLDTGARYSPVTDSWVNTGRNDTPSARAHHTATWTGSEMIVWGGHSQNFLPLNTGGKYNPGIDSWIATSTSNAPDARDLHTAVWTGSEIVVWGGSNQLGDLDTGGRYNPNTDTWMSTSTANAPSSRDSHTAVWAGSEMIVWGGEDQSFVLLNTGGRYNPGTNSWVATSTGSAPSARDAHTAVWTGSQMIIWGGYDNNPVNTGGRYNPGTNSWTATSTTNAPDARDYHTAVWTGNEMVIWAGASGATFFQSGGKYNPATNSWVTTSTTNAPEARQYHTALWTGTEMIAWGGLGQSITDINTGGRYNPSTDSWIATTTINAPSARDAHTAIWTGSEMIIWGGGDASGDFESGGRYCAQSGPSPTPTATATASPTSTFTPTPIPTATPTPTPIPTPTPCDSGVIINGGFETGFFDGWIIIDPSVPEPTVTDTEHHSGNYSAFAGGNPPQFCGNGTELTGDSSFFQSFTVPAGGGTLSFWYWTCTTDTIASDWQDAYITDANSHILQTIFHQCTNNQAWVQQTVDMTPYAGQRVGIRILVHQNGFGNLTGMYVDDVSLYVPCGTPTPTATPTATATVTVTPSSTPRVTPTPRSRPTPKSRPTPPPHLTPVPPPPSPRPTPWPRP